MVRGRRATSNPIPTRSPLTKTIRDVASSWGCIDDGETFHPYYTRDILHTHSALGVCTVTFLCGFSNLMLHRRMIVVCDVIEVTINILMRDRESGRCRSVESSCDRCRKRGSRGVRDPAKASKPSLHPRRLLEWGVAEICSVGDGIYEENL